ncbi:MAG: hypothetical protein J5699_00455, partial [Bacteroidales bacterium]|nr:hypothetical protein [Bacteroidales bacterium]
MDTIDVRQSLLWLMARVDMGGVERSETVSNGLTGAGRRLKKNGQHFCHPFQLQAIRCLQQMYSCGKAGHHDGDHRHQLDEDV